MSRLAKILALGTAAVAVAAVTAACGTQKISVPTSEAQLHSGRGAVQPALLGLSHALLRRRQRLRGEYPHGPGNSGPNFNQRCERPIDRVLYAIENGGFSGAYMPQNVVVGQDALDVAKFVATYAGRQAPARAVGCQRPCESKAIGQLPARHAR